MAIVASLQPTVNFETDYTNIKTLWPPVSKAYGLFFLEQTYSTVVQKKGLCLHTGFEWLKVPQLAEMNI